MITKRDSSKEVLNIILFYSIRIIKDLSRLAETDSVLRKIR